MFVKQLLNDIYKYEDLDVNPHKIFCRQTYSKAFTKEARDG